MIWGDDGVRGGPVPERAAEVHAVSHIRENPSEDVHGDRPVRLHIPGQGVLPPDPLSIAICKCSPMTRQCRAGAPPPERCTGPQGPRAPEQKMCRIFQNYVYPLEMDPPPSTA